MDMLRHDYKTDNEEAIPLPSPLQSMDKNIFVFGARQQGPTMIASKSDIVEVLSLLIALETRGHEFTLGRRLNRCL